VQRVATVGLKPQNRPLSTARNAVGNEEVLQTVNKTKTMLDKVGKRKRVVRACVRHESLLHEKNQTQKMKGDSSLYHDILSKPANRKTE